jgi:hypothetical protein
MTRRPPRARYLAPLVVVAAFIAGCSAVGATPTHHPSAKPSPAPPLVAPPLVLAEHLVTQEGLAIALASNVLQTQLQLVSDASDDSPLVACTALSGGGAKKVTDWSGTSAARTLTDVTYYDTGCAHPYLTARATATQAGDSDNLAASVAYTGSAGAALGTLVTTASATFSGNGLVLEGTGTLTRAAAAPVSLGLACQAASDTVLNCQGGVAQSFPTLTKSVGSITPLTLTVGANASDPITFQGTGNSTATAAPGSLSITSPDGAHLVISGATTATGSSVTTGQAGGFVLFPPTPTGWTITDAADDVSFTIAVTDNTTRALTGSVTQLSTKRTLATLSVDQSGTGTITYLGQKPAAVDSWTLTN